MVKVESDALDEVKERDHHDPSESCSHPVATTNAQNRGESSAGSLVALGCSVAPRPDPTR